MAASETPDRSSTTSEAAEGTPLKPAVFHILLSLSAADLHGLGIADEVEALTGGQIRLGPGTLYRSLKEMTRDGLVAEVEAPREDDDPRRKYYGITETGRVALEAEVTRYERLVDAARKRKVTSESRT